MLQVNISFKTVHDIEKFVKTLDPLDGDFELISGKRVLDARSLMGFFSLELTNPITLKIYNDTEENINAISPFLAQTEASINE